ncbi:MAG: 50S ribosomal protein L4 [Verrucomicrobiota bacterium]
MAATQLTADKAREAEIELADAVKGQQAVHDVVTAMRANRRNGSANSKTRGEVSGSNKKPWRQKGTGRARAGRTSSPIWRGGGVVFGPRPRDYSKAVNKSTRRLALRAALGSRIEEGDVLMVSSLDIPDGKTKSFVSALRDATDSHKVLVVAEAFSEATYLAARNYKGALLMTASEVNTEQLINFDKIILTEDSLPTFSRRTRKP